MRFLPVRRPQWRGDNGNEMQFEVCCARQTTKVLGLLGEKRTIWWRRGRAIQRENSRRKGTESELKERPGVESLEEPWMGSEDCSYCLDNRMHFSLLQCLCLDVCCSSYPTISLEPFPQKFSTFPNSTLLLGVSLISTFSSFLSPLNMPTALF